MSSNKLTINDLRRLVDDAFKNFEAARVGQVIEDEKKLESIMNAIEFDLTMLMIEQGYGDDVAREYSSASDLVDMIGSDPINAFNAGRNSYRFSPLNQEDKSCFFSDSAQYIAFDRYHRLVSIDNRAHLAFWYRLDVEEYLSGGRGEQDTDALQELAEVFGGDFV